MKTLTAIAAVAGFLLAGTPARAGLHMTLVFVGPAPTGTTIVARPPAGTPASGPTSRPRN